MQSKILGSETELEMEDPLGENIEEKNVENFLITPNLAVHSLGLRVEEQMISEGFQLQLGTRKLSSSE